MNVKRFIALLLIGVLLMAWLAGGYGFRKKITVQNTNIDSNLTDFPVYVDITADGDIGGEARSDGFDLRFTQSDGTTLLKYEREYFNIAASVATGHFWVKVPSLLASGTNEIYIYYGKSDATDGEDAANVWDANFIMVHHMKDTTTSTITDSTSNNNDGTKQGVNEPIEANGKIHKGQDFDGIDDYIDVTQVFDSETSFSIEAWVFVRGGRYMVSQWTGNDGAFIQSSGITGGNFDLQAFVDGSGTSEYQYSLSNWHHIFLTYDATNMNFYANGGLIEGPSARNFTIPAESMFLGDRSDHAREFDGVLDEVRVSNDDRTAAWIKFTHANMNEGDNELDWGGEESDVTHYSLVIDAGSYSLTGQTTNLLKGSLVDIEAGSYALTGQVMTPLKGSHIDIVSGSYSLGGQVVILLKDHIIGIASGNYALSGQTVGLFFGWRISIDAGSYALTGQVADLLKGSKVSVDVGSYALTGQVAGVYYGRKFSVDSGSYSLSGQIASLLKGSKVGIDSGSYALTGQVVNLLKGSHVDIEAGAYTLSGQIASLLKGSHIDLASGTYILTGFAVDLILSAKSIDIEPGAYILTGFAVDLDYVSVGFPIIFDVEPRERIFDLTGRTRIYNISPRGRIFDREN